MVATKGRHTSEQATPNWLAEAPPVIQAPPMGNSLDRGLNG